MRQTPFARIIGMFGISNPYKNQNNIPMVIIQYIPIEMLWVSPVLITFAACGNCAIAVQKPAMYPITTISNVIDIIFCKSNKKIRLAQKQLICAKIIHTNVILKPVYLIYVRS